MLIFVGTIDVANITATKDITIFIGQFFFRTNFTTVDMYFGLTEHITIGEEVTAIT